VAPRIRFAPSGRQVEVPAGTPLDEAARRAGLPLASSCRGEGLCARCGVRILRGAPHVAAEDAAERDAKRRNRVDPELRLACRVTVGVVIGAAAGAACGPDGRTPGPDVAPGDPGPDLEVTTPYW